MQVSHWQEALHVCVPPITHGCVAPGTQDPWFMHGPQSDQVPLLQTRDCVPQLPQAWVAGPVQVWAVHRLHWHAPLQVWEPPMPQACVAPGAQAPWFMHAPQSDQVPLLHVRDCVPQLPQAWVMAPLQVCPPHDPH
jgi:hypothetical protein